MIVLQHESLTLQVRDTGYPRRILNLKLNIKRSMNGDIKTTKQTPVTTTHEQPVAFLSTTDLTNFINFIEAKLGATIQYIDRDAISWSVKIISDPEEIIDEARHHRTSTLRMVSING